MESNDGKPRFKPGGIVLTEDLLDRLKIESNRRALSKSAIVREALRVYLDAQTTAAKPA